MPIAKNFASSSAGAPDDPLDELIELAESVAGAVADLRVVAGGIHLELAHQVLAVGDQTHVRGAHRLKGRFAGQTSACVRQASARRCRSSAWTRR